MKSKEKVFSEINSIMKQKIFNNTPKFFQELLISLYNYKAYKVRYGGEYNYFLKKFKQNRNLTREELVTINEKRYREFILKAIDNSAYYKELYKGIENPEDIKNISKLELLTLLGHEVKHKKLIFV